MKFFLILSILTNLSLGLAKDENKLNKNDILSWPRASAVTFGCFLEKQFEYKDKKFNCDLKSDKGQSSDEGPAFPHLKVSKVHKDISNIDLFWEHGELQGVHLTLAKKMSEAEVRKEFKLPIAQNFPRPNVMNISIQQCSLKATCIVIQGFDHIGVGD